MNPKFQKNNLKDDCSICGHQNMPNSQEKKHAKKTFRVYIQDIPQTINEAIRTLMKWAEKRRFGNGDSQDREHKAKVNELRMAEELAFGAMAGAIPILSKKDMADHAEILCARETKRRSPFYQELEPILTLKCDVSVLSTYKQIFLFMDVLLKTRLWSDSEDVTT